MSASSSLVTLEAAVEDEHLAGGEELLAELSAFGGVASGDGGVEGAGPEDLEREVEFGGSVAVAASDGPGHAWQSLQERAIDGDEVLEGRPVRMRRTFRDLGGELAENAAEERGVEEVLSFGEGAEADGRTTDEALDAEEGGGLLKAAEAGESGREEVKEGGRVAVVGKQSIASPVASGTIATELSEAE